MERSEAGTASLFSETTAVQFDQLPEAAIRAYVKSGAQQSSSRQCKAAYAQVEVQMKWWCGKCLTSCRAEECFGKAGAYGIQGPAMQFVSRIEVRATASTGVLHPCPVARWHAACAQHMCPPFITLTNACTSTTDASHAAVTHVWCVTGRLPQRDGLSLPRLCQARWATHRVWRAGSLRGMCQGTAPLVAIGAIAVDQTERQQAVMGDPELEPPEVTTIMTSVAAASSVLHSGYLLLGGRCVDRGMELNTVVPPFLFADAASMAPAPSAGGREQGRYFASSSVVRQGSPLFPPSARLG